MKKYTQIKTELKDIVVREIVKKYMISNNEQIENDIEAGIKKAFETIDLEKTVEMSVRNTVKKIIEDSYNWSKIQDEIRKKMDEIVEIYVEKSMAKFKQNFTK